MLRPQGEEELLTGLWVSSLPVGRGRRGFEEPETQGERAVGIKAQGELWDFHGSRPRQAHAVETEVDGRS